MKKSLVLAMAMALGVTASAYAANSFSDVPAGHWAYDSIAKLAAEGVVDGYPDGTFGGSRLITRYEMAQIVARAMAKGASDGRLEAEFADELDALGVRVARLEKKSDNVKITGEIRYKYMSTDHGFENDLRTRIWSEGQVNDTWTYTAMVENTQDFSNNVEENETRFRNVFVKGKLGGIKVTAGRYETLFADGNIYDEMVDGAAISYGEKFKVTGFAGKSSGDITTSIDGDDSSGGTYAGAEIAAEFTEDSHLSIGYFNFRDVADVTDLNTQIFCVGADYKIGEVTIKGMYLRGNPDSRPEFDFGDSKSGFTVGLEFMGAEPEEVGSWGIFANYYNQPGSTYIAHTTDANVYYGHGFRGYGVGANYTFAKNLVGTVVYYDTKNRMDTSERDKRIWTDLTFTF